MARDIGGFGRLPAPFDGRDTLYLMRAAMPQVRAAVPPAPRKRAYNEGPLLNQGPFPYCVGYAGRGFLNAAPIMTKADREAKPGHDAEANLIYREAQKRDEWQGEGYDGTSVRGAMKWLKEAGHVSSYVWGQTVDEATAWMNGGYGTVILGTDWYQDFDGIPADGYMRMPAQLNTPIGGHAYRLNWFDKKQNAFLVINSWGTHWGMASKTGEPMGRAYMKVDLLAFLLKSSGEIAAPTQVKIKPTLV